MTQSLEIRLKTLTSLWTSDWLYGADIIVLLPKCAVLQAHGRAHDAGAVQAQGSVVPLVGRETKTAGEHGRNVVMAAVCWEPGSRTLEQTQVQIGNNGLWEALP